MPVGPVPAQLEASRTVEDSLREELGALRNVDDVNAQWSDSQQLTASRARETAIQAELQAALGREEQLHAQFQARQLVQQASLSAIPGVLRTSRTADEQMVGMDEPGSSEQPGSPPSPALVTSESAGWLSASMQRELEAKLEAAAEREAALEAEVMVLQAQLGEQALSEWMEDDGDGGRPGSPHLENAAGRLSARYPSWLEEPRFSLHPSWLQEHDETVEEAEATANQLSAATRGSADTAAGVAAAQAAK